MLNDKVIGREPEEEVINSIFKSNTSEFVAVYGRRRVGKTFLIRKTLKSRKNSIYFEVMGSKNSPMKEQISHFLKEISECFYHNAPLANVNDWNSAFDILNDALKLIPKNKKIVLFFDELPWLVTPNSRLLDVISYYWNKHWVQDERIKFIICGSSASWIIKKIIKNKGGLHNRITHKINLKPFNLSQTKDFLKYKGANLNETHILQLYMVMGGIPFYLNNVQKGESSTQTIDRMAFSNNGILLEEFDILLASLFDNYEDHIEILTALSKCKSGIGKEVLIKQLRPALHGATGSNRIKELEEAGFIQGFMPHFHKRQGKYYRLIDEYVIFYFDWIKGFRNTLEASTNNIGYWHEMQQSSKWSTWQGFAFEAICYKHILQIKSRLNIPAGSVSNTWRYIPKKNSSNKGAQIDLLFDRNDDTITLVEIKCTNKPFAIDKAYAETLNTKLKVFQTQTKTSKQLYWNMISAKGIRENDYKETLIMNHIQLKDLFKKL